MAPNAMYPTSPGVRAATACRADLAVPDEVLEEFTVSVLVAAAQTVLHLRGEIDCLSSPYLRGILDASIETGSSTVILDLAELDFMDGSGLRVIANAADRLFSLGGALAIRSPSELVARMLDITGMAELAIPNPRPAARVS
jgi:anti-anti-sigma factor